MNILHCFSVILMLLLMFTSCNQSTKNTIDEITEKSVNSRIAIELILEKEAHRDSLMIYLEGISMDFYKWKNHIVLFGYPEDTTGITNRIGKSGIRTGIKYFNEPMYVFDRTKNCSDTVIQEPWNDYLLTANLVKDSGLQKEYVAYHKKQFEEWPEVAQGFCYAGFQQLLVYKNGRQLLLVISIPADKMLDELNPKTIENNPRMVEWNNIMGKYQEGIKGTDPGETWVFLEKTNITN